MYYLIFDKLNIICSLICIDRKVEKLLVVEIGWIKNFFSIFLIDVWVWFFNIKEKFNSFV